MRLYGAKCLALLSPGKMIGEALCFHHGYSLFLGAWDGVGCGKVAVLLVYIGYYKAR